ncbi:MAG TPA: nickel-dependent lactate racemase, partial [Bacillota bacterium]|nr:nickel-dependent lactate racemase [Bacillota bacterium]
AKQPARVAIVVNDITRPTPYDLMLPPLLEELREAGLKADQITLVVATGSHRAHTPEENRRSFGTEVAENYRIISHDCNAPDLVAVGKLGDGTELIINKEVAQADMVITTGLITLHYIAGFSGGRKSILPGVAARHLIQQSHAMMVDPRARTGNYPDNPVHLRMLEAARLAGVDFILNVVTNEQKQIVEVVAGEVEQAWLKGVEVCARLNMLNLKEPADVAIACAGGAPKDINLYQAQKAMDAAAAAVRPGGTIILVAKCPEGLGEHTFERWLDEATCLQDIFDHFDRGFELGGHKAFAIAQVLRDKEVVLVSDLGREVTAKLYMTYAPDLEWAIHYVNRKHGTQYSCYVMPQAGMIFPEVLNN